MDRSGIWFGQCHTFQAKLVQENKLDPPIACEINDWVVFRVTVERNQGMDRKCKLQVNIIEFDVIRETPIYGGTNSGFLDHPLSYINF